MAQPSTLNAMADLKNSGFGRPWPRHGLKLLYWFANNYIDFDSNNQIMLNYDHKKGGFGFHHFQNRRDNCDNYGCSSLLPEEGYPYYEVGNLGQQNADNLPDYVKEDYTGLLDGSNSDRIIISLRQDQQVEKVYVTHHEDIKSFDPTHTYPISRGLLMIIRNLSRHDFLNQAGYDTARKPGTFVYQSQSLVHRESGGTAINLRDAAVHEERGFWETWCTIL